MDPCLIHANDCSNDNIFMSKVNSKLDADSSTVPRINDAQKSFK